MGCESPKPTIVKTYTSKWYECPTRNARAFCSSYTFILFTIMFYFRNMSGFLSRGCNVLQCIAHVPPPRILVSFWGLFPSHTIPLSDVAFKFTKPMATFRSTAKVCCDMTDCGRILFYFPVPNIKKYSRKTPPSATVFWPKKPLLIFRYFRNEKRDCKAPVFSSDSQQYNNATIIFTTAVLRKPTRRCGKGENVLRKRNAWRKQDAFKVY